MTFYITTPAGRQKYADWTDYERQHTALPVMKNKYGAKRATSVLKELAGRSFASQLERDRATELVMLQRAGSIKGLRFQPSVRLDRWFYKPDFVYTENGELIYEETKGFEDVIWKRNLKLWRELLPGKLRIMRRMKGGRIVMTEEIR